MPSKPKRPCAQPGCPELVDSGYCDKHKQQAGYYDKQRGSSSARGYGSRWQKYRRLWLSRQPLCIHCLDKNRVTQATDVDHIVAVSGPSDPLFWRPSNHQSLCHSCHSSKTARENGGFGIR